MGNNDPSFTRILSIVWKTFCAILLIAVIVGFAFYAISATFGS